MNEDTKLAKIALMSGRFENGRVGERGNYLFNVDTRCKSRKLVVPKDSSLAPHFVTFFYFSLSPYTKATLAVDIKTRSHQNKVPTFYLRVFSFSTFEGPIFWAAL